MSQHVAHSLPPPVPSITTTATAPTVEVTTTFGDSVVGVDHVSDPQGGRTSRTTWALLCGGAMLLVTAALVFTMTVRWAARDAERRTEWVEKLHRPAYAFRPTMVGRGLDWLALGGLGFGLATVAVGLWRRRDERRSPYVRIGTAPGVAIATTEAPSRDFPLVAPHGNGFVVHVAPSMAGDLQLAGRSVAIAELIAQPSLARATAAPEHGLGTIAIPVDTATRMRLRCGATSFHIAAIAQPRRQPTPLIAGIDRRAMAYLIGSAVAHMLLWAFLRTIPPGTETASADLSGIEPTGINVTAVSTADQNPEKPEPGTSAGGGADDKLPSAAAMAEGITGAKEPIAGPSATRKIKQRDNDPGHARENAIEEAREAGVLGAFQSSSGDLFAALTGDRDLSSGFDDSDLVGGAIGDGNGAPQGFGDGYKGFGPGGGGKDWNSIHGGDYNTIDGGKGTGDDFRFPGGGGGPRPGHNPPAIVDTVGKPTVSGEIDANTLRRYIRRYLSRISYCYEKELLAKPGIGGTINTDFVINAGGTVVSATATGFDDDVTGCVIGVVKSIKFPHLADSGFFNVKYPFTMHPAGH